MHSPGPRRRPISDVPRLTLLLAVACLGLLTGCGPTTLVIGVTPGDQRLDKTVVLNEAGKRQVLLVDLDGMLVNARRPGLLRERENPVAAMQEKLRYAAIDPAVEAVVLRINSPGGTVTASDIVYRELDRFRETSGKPVVSLLMDVAASGGYYVALAGDEIVAHPTTITGSIGVIVQTFSVKPALARLGVTTDAIKSGPNKDAGSPMSNMTDAQRATLQELVDDFYARFVDLVATRRAALAAEDMAMATDGRVFSGTDAADLGLVDATGDLHDAFARAKALAGLDSADLVLYHRPLEYVASPYAAAPAGPPATTQINLAQFNLDAGLLGGMPAGAYYLWTSP
jgi:protease-4